MQLAGNLARVLPIKSEMAYSRAKQHGFSFPKRAAQPIEPSDAAYPAQLRDLPSRPESLWFAGRVPSAGQRLVAIVGARAASRMGCDRAHALAAELGRGGAAIVSGGAFGIDAAAHEGALDIGATTFAVLGCGTDVVYPDRHADLFARIAASGGGLLSEYPPGTKPRHGQFPARNRIIAGLAQAVIVVEAAMRSGALITARLGRAYGRILFAVPGSPGTDATLRAGLALPATTAADIERALAGGQPVPVPVPVPAPPAPGPMASVLDAIALGADAPASLCERLGIPLPSILAILAEAELEGFVRRAAGNTYEVIGRVC
jgi:DNA processing protein